jgi:predicted transposase YdaD
VASVVVLLRSQADGTELDGELRRADPMGGVSLSFRYRGIRVWQRPVEELLTGGLGILPLAPLAAVERDQMPAVVERMVERSDREAPPDVARNLWAATSLLLGLRYDDRTVREVVRNMSWLQESSTYQAILREGREEGVALGREEGVTLGREEGQGIGRILEARRMFLRQGERRFGTPCGTIIAAVEAISDIDRLEQLSLELLSATGWDELLGGAASS